MVPLECTNSKLDYVHYLTEACFQILRPCPWLSQMFLETDLIHQVGVSLQQPWSSGSCKVRKGFASESCHAKNPLKVTLQK